jgi:hypothetical protein
MDDLVLRADCARCAALCCVSLAFDRSELFGFDKAAGVACPHLGREGVSGGAPRTPHRCGIYPELERMGFAGCAGYDCLGAGQRVTQELFGGRSWREHPALARSMFDAFRAMRQVHELLSLLQTAGQLPLSPAQARRRGELCAALCPPQGWSVESIEAFERGQLPGEIRSFLASLRDRVPRAWRGRGGASGLRGAEHRRELGSAARPCLGEDALDVVLHGEEPDR